MADFKLTTGKDTVNGPKTDDYHTYYGLDGDDAIRIYMGNVVGGAGNDRIERIASSDWWRMVTAAYWDSPASVTVDLQAGYADDGWGGRDTLVNITNVSGSWNGDMLYGDNRDNGIWTGGGSNVIDGRGGTDTVYLPGLDGRARMSDYKVEVSVDGRYATITSTNPELPNFRNVMTDVERIGIEYGVTFAVADYIKPMDMATQALASDHRWNSSLGAPVEIAFGFATTAPASGAGAAGFKAFTPAQQQIVRGILNSLSGMTGLTFRETTDASEPGLQFGVSQQANTKGLSSMPGETNAGQIWMDVESMAALTPGSEGYAVLLHEIGHALGLRHPRNAEAGDNYAVQWRAADDTTNRTVMSQQASADGLFPSTFGAYDIAALRYMYGSKEINAGNNNYVLSGTAFTSQTAIVDDGGTDTLDASKSTTGVTLDLNPGKLSSVGVTAAGVAAVNNLSIELGAQIENAAGSIYDDALIGNALDNRLTGGLGNDWIDGGAGIDTAVFAGKRDDYLLSTGFGKWFVTARDGVGGFDTLTGIEKLAFADGTLTLNTAALAADVEIAVDQGASVSGLLPTADEKGIVYALGAGPAHGSVTVAANGAFVYTPNAGATGADVFSFTLKNADGVIGTYKGFVTIRTVAAAPAASGGHEGATAMDGAAPDTAGGLPAGVPDDGAHGLALAAGGDVQLIGLQQTLV